MSGTTAVSSRATVSMSNTISEQDFKTPDRSTTKSLSSVVTGSHTEEKKEDALNNCGDGIANNRNSAKLVTPPDSFSTGSSKEVRFDKKNSSNKNTTGIEAKTLCTVGSDEGDSSSTSSPTASNRGLVSRRGGRCGSPGRTLLPPPATGAKPTKAAADAAAAVLEFKTFRSPERDANIKQEDSENESSNDNDDSRNDGSRTTIKNESLLENERENETSNYRRQQKPSTKVTSNGASVSKKSNNVSFSPVPPARTNGDKVRHFLFSFVCYYVDFRQ